MRGSHVHLFKGYCTRLPDEPLGAKGFVVLHGRWVVERTFGWLGRYRRLSKDYEREPGSSEAMIRIAMIQIMLRKLKPVPALAN
jgi:putative transposase